MLNASRPRRPAPRRWGLGCGPAYSGATWGSSICRRGGRRCGSPREQQRRPPRRQIDDPHVAPEYAGPQPSPQRLGAGLRGREAFSIGGGAAGASCRFLTLGLGENAVEEPVAEAVERRLDAADVDQVVADSEDQGSPATAICLRLSASGAELAHGLCARLVHDRTHTPDCGKEPAEDRL